MAVATTTPKGPLAVPAFRYLWLNTITFFMAMNALRFVYGWVALDGLDSSESVQGFVVFALGLPGIFLLLPAGVWADRLNRRHLLIATQMGTAVVLFATAATIGAGHLSLPFIVVSAVLAGITTAIGSPVRGSLIPELLPKELLFGGIALNALAMTSSLVVGAVTAQVAGDLFGFDGAYWYLTILLVLGVLALIPMQTPNRAPGVGDHVTMRKAVVEGLGFVHGQPALRILFLMLGLAGFIMNALMFVTLQALVKDEFGRDAGDAAPLMALIGVGLAISSVYVMRRGNMKNKGTVFLRAMICGTSLLVLMGQTTAYWQLGVLSLFMGMAGGFFVNMNQGLIQSNTPNELMGRVMGLFSLVQMGLTPFGALVVGFVAEAIGPANAFSVCAGVALLVTLATYARAHELHAIQT